MSLPLSLLAVAVSANVDEFLWVVLSVLALIASAIWFSTVRDNITARWRWVVLALGVAVVPLVGARALQTRVPVLADILWFLGGTMVMLSAALLLSHARKVLPTRAGTWVTVGAVLLLIIGCVPALADGPWYWLLGAGLVAGIVGMELLAEASVRQRWFDGRRRCAVIAGLAVVLATGGYLVGVGVDPTHAVLLVLGVGVVVWMAVADNDSLALAVLVSIALLWATSAGRSELDARVQPRADEGYYVALGDSYMSGEGAREFISGTNTVEPNESRTNECRRATSAWGYRLAEVNYGLEDVPHRVLFLPCSGAVAGNIDTVEYKPNKHQAIQLAEYQAAVARFGKPKFVVMGIGGNDAGFSDIGATCVGPGDCSRVGQQMLDRLRTDVPQRLAAAYERVSAVVGDDVPVLIVPYPIPMDAREGPCSSVLLSANERAFVVGFIQQLNLVIQQQVRQHGEPNFHYVGTVERALGNRLLCGERGLAQGLNFLALNPKEGALAASINPKNWTHNSLHPTAEGHEAIRQAVVNWLGDHPEVLDDGAAGGGTTGAAPGSGVGGTSPDAPTFDSSRLPVNGTVRFFAQCTPEGERACSFDGSGWVLAETQALVRSVLPGMVFLIGGWWTALSAVMAWARQRGLSTIGLIQVATAPPPAGPGRTPSQVPLVPPGPPPVAPAVLHAFETVNARLNVLRRDLADAAMPATAVQQGLAGVRADIQAALDVLTGVASTMPDLQSAVETARAEWSAIVQRVDGLDGTKPVPNGDQSRVEHGIHRMAAALAGVTVPPRLDAQLAGMSNGDEFGFGDQYALDFPDASTRTAILKSIAARGLPRSGYVDVGRGTVTKVDVRLERWLLSAATAAVIATVSVVALLGLNAWSDAPLLPDKADQIGSGAVLASLLVVWLGMVGHVLFEWFKGGDGGSPGGSSLRRTLFLIMAKERSVYLSIVLGAALTYGFALTGQLGTPLPLLAIGYSADSIVNKLAPHFDSQLRAMADAVTPGTPPVPGGTPPS